MLKLYPEQLYNQLNKGLYAVYLLLGDVPLLLQESQDVICQVAAMHGFNERNTIQIDNSTDWRTIFSFCQSINIFISKKILVLILPENSLNIKINEHLAKLMKLIHNDLLLILRSNKLTKAQENAAWFKQMPKQTILVICQIPEKMQLLKWVAERARRHNLQLDKSACQLLCYCYEGNLLALAQALDRLSLLWPNSKLNRLHVEQVINNNAHFMPYQWIDALLTAKSERALHILYQLRLEGNEPVVLLRTLQYELLLLVNLKRQSMNISWHVLLDKYRIWQNRRAMITKAINRLSYDRLCQAVHFLTKIELNLKQNYEYVQSIWAELENLSLLLCHKTKVNIFN